MISVITRPGTATAFRCGFAFTTKPRVLAALVAKESYERGNPFQNIDV